jgi:hypothetical protein
MILKLTQKAKLVPSKIKFEGGMVNDPARIWANLIQRQVTGSQIVLYARSRVSQ